MQHDKHWLTNLAGELLTLQIDQDLLKAIGNLALNLESEGAARDPAALARFIARLSETALAEHPALAGDSELIPRMRELFSGDLPDAAKLLVCRPAALVSGACGDLPRRLDWDVVNRSVAAPGVAGGDLGFQLGAGASSRLVFDVGVTPPAGAALPSGTSLLRVTLKGGAKATADLNFPIHLGNAGVDLDSASAMEVDYYFAVPANEILATTAADCLASLANPFSLDDVAGKLRRTKLLAISLSADGRLAIGGRLQVGLGPQLAGSVEASLGVQAGFRTSRSGRFRMNLTAGDGAGAPGSVLLDLKREQASAQAKNIAIGLTLGLTELVADLTPQILEHAGKAQHLLASLDQFLPPSKFVQQRIESELRTRIQSPGIEQVALELFDDSADAPDLDRLVQEIGTAIDTRARLWQDKATELSTEATRDLLENWKATPGTPQEQARRAEMFALIGPLVGSVIERSIEDLHQGLKDKLKQQTGGTDALFNDLVSRLQDAGGNVSGRATSAGARLDEVAAPVTDQLAHFQQTLSKLVSALKHSGELKVDACWRWEEQRSEGQTLTQQILFRPSETDGERNHPQSAEKLYSRTLTGSLDSVFEAALAQSRQGPSAPVSLRDGTLKRFAGLERSSGFELILLDFQLGSSDMLKADVEVETDAGGNIRVYARSESSVGWFSFGERHEFRTVNIYELATARKTRRMTFSLSLSQLDEDLGHKEVEQFFSGLEDGSIALLPKGRGAKAIAELKKVAKTNPGTEQSGELRVWLELDDDAVRRLLQIRGTDPANRFAPFDEDRVYEVSIDAMLAGLAVTGSGTVSNNLERFVTKETSARSLRALLMDFNDDHHRRARRPHPADSGFLGSASNEYDLLIRISDRARGFAKALKFMRSVYFGNPDWSAADYRDRQEQIDEHIKFWVKGEPADKGLLSLFRDDSIRPYMLGLLKAVTDLVQSDDGRSGQGQLLASIVLHLENGREREVRLSEPPPPTLETPRPDVPAGLAFDKSRVPPVFVRSKGPEQASSTTGRKKMVDYVFPLHQRPSIDFESGARFFGARRSGGKRKHAGCDLLMPVGTPVLAMADGTVTKGPYDFYEGTSALEVTSDNKDERGYRRVIRYGEIKNQVPKGIRTDVKVMQGQVIAYVGRLRDSGNSMLHLEIYKGTKTGRLTQRGANAFSRRADVENPAPYLKQAPLVSELDQSQLSAKTREQAPKKSKKPVHGTLNEHVSSKLYIRNESKLDSEPVATLSKADPSPEILRRVTGGPYPYGDRTTWYLVKTFRNVIDETDGKSKNEEVQGYVVAFFLKPDAEFEEVPKVDWASKGVVSRKRLTGPLRVREAPYLSAKTMDQSLNPGDIIEILDPEVEGDTYKWDHNDWVQIRRGTLEGFAAGYFIDLVEPENPDIDRPNVDVQADDEPDEWAEALKTAPTDGASARTARGVSGSGIEASKAMAQQDLDLVIKHAGRFVSAGNRTAVLPAILAAIASRESRCGRVLDNNGEGDRGMAFGIMQVDKRHHNVEGRPDPRSIAHIEQAAAIFNNNLVAVQNKFPDWSKGYLMKAAAAAYNFGVSNVRTKEGIDKGSTGDDYGSDVIARAQFYYNHPDLELFRA